MIQKLQAMTHKHLFLTLALAATTIMAQAQTTGAAPAPVTHAEFVNNTVVVLVIMVIVVLLLAFIVLLNRNTQLIKALHEAPDSKKESATTPAPAPDTIYKKPVSISDKLYDLFIMDFRKPDEDMMLEHAYDGIHELDNKMPPWLRGVFYLTIVIAAIYLLRYHVYTSWSSKAEYEQEMADASVSKSALLATQKSTVDETKVEQLTDATALASGKKVYLEKCIACHGNKGEGGVGPNLTDEFWLHGCSMADIFKTIKYGVPAKGMLTWNGVLSPDEIQQVASYVMSLKGTNPPNGKAAQGDKCEPAANAGATEAATPADTTQKKGDTKIKAATPGK